MRTYRRYLAIVVVAWLTVAVPGWVWAQAYVPFIGVAVLFAILIATLPPMVVTQWLVAGPLRAVHRKRLADLVAAAAVSVAWTASVISVVDAASIFAPDPPMTPQRFVVGVLFFGAATTVIVERSLRLATPIRDGPGVGTLR